MNTAGGHTPTTTTNTITGRPGDRQTGGPQAAVPADVGELHRLCVCELDLTCGHCLTVSLNGWYPVSAACCDRLSGHWFDGTYYPFASQVEYVRCLEERYERRPPGTEREPLRVLDRRTRTDDAFVAVHRWQQVSGGRFPARVGGPFNHPVKGAAVVTEPARHGRAPDRNTTAAPPR